jgi:hypothetical protein
MSTGIREYLPTFEAVDAERGDFLWLGPALFGGGLVVAAYLATHPYPAFGAGLYFAIAEQISLNGYGLPATVAGYADPVPFAYPPLLFYVLAGLRDLTGLDPLTISRLLPGLVTLAYLVPAYLLARELLGSTRQAGVAALAIAISPPILKWHLSAGGVVRAPATLFLLAGLYAASSHIRTRDRRWLAATTVLFALTVLTHPMYAAFFAASFAWLSLALDGSLAGFRDGLVVGLGGLALAAPWWAQVVAAHGPRIFTRTAGTHSGLVTGALSVGPVTVPGPVLLVAAVPVVVLAGLALPADGGRPTARRNVFLVGWLVFSFLVVPRIRFQFLAGAFLLPVVVFEGARPRLRRLEGVVPTRRPVAVGLVVIACAGLAVGGLYVSNAMESHTGRESMPAFVDDADLEAMDWVEANTASDASVAVMGDAAEWFPVYAQRDIAAGPWGMEWYGTADFQDHLQQYLRLSTCGSAGCVAGTMDAGALEADYLYVPKEPYTVWGSRTPVADGLWRDLRGSAAFTLVYQNAGTGVFRVNDEATTAVHAAGAGPIQSAGGDPATAADRPTDDRSIHDDHSIRPLADGTREAS